MASPETIYLLEYIQRDFITFVCDDVTVHIEKEVADAQERIAFVIPDAGTFEITAT